MSMTRKKTQVSKVLPAPPKGKEDRHFVTALARGLEVLGCFRSGDRLLGNIEIARRCGLPKSTVSRLTYTLTRIGYLHYDEDSGKYRLGTATLALGSKMLARLDVRQMARPLMQALADFTGAAVSLGTRDRLSMIYVEHCRSQSAITISLDVGSRIPLATTAVGRAYLAATSGGERHATVALIRELDEFAWPKLREGLEKGLKEYAELGCCCPFGGWQKDVNAIAVAFRPGSAMPPMSINCGGPAFTLSPEFLMNEARPRLIELVRHIEESLGGA